MLKDPEIHQIEDIEFKVVYSRRRSLGISVLLDASVIVRVPNRTSFKTISRIVREKYRWIIKHRDNYRKKEKTNKYNSYQNGDIHLFRGIESVLKIEYSGKPYIRFSDHIIEMGLKEKDDPVAIKKLLYKGYKEEAQTVFPDFMNRALEKCACQAFNPTGLIIRTMKRRWGSCSNKGMITLSTELIKLPDLYLEYVIIHELCHLKHHNHGSGYYKLLSELFPDWKAARKDMRTYFIH
jgi:predicted metal-dependent hydrolase